MALAVVNARVNFPYGPPDSTSQVPANLILDIVVYLDDTSVSSCWTEVGFDPADTGTDVADTVADAVQAKLTAMYDLGQGPYPDPAGITVVIPTLA